MPATGNKAKTEVVSDILNEGPTGGITQNNVLKNVESVVSISKKHKKKGNRVLRFFTARWGESKVPIGLTLDAGLKNEKSQEISHMSWLYDRRSALTRILRDPDGLAAFRAFIESEYTSENLLFWLEIESLKTEQNREQLTKIAKLLMDRFSNEGSINISDQERHDFAIMLRDMVINDTNEIDDSVRQATEIEIKDNSDDDIEFAYAKNYVGARNGNVSEGEGNLLDTVQNSVLSLMAMDCLPRFLVCNTGDKYIKSLTVKNQGDDKEFVDQLKTFQAQAKSVAKPDSIQEWLTKFICLAYMLPFCVTISTRVENPGIAGEFPLSFVNPEFTRVTGYSHEETVGRNCRFLQGPYTEQEAVEKLRTAIRDGTKIHTSITNYCKDGEMFKNLLTLHPVFNKKGEHVFIVGVQYDVSEMTLAKFAALSPILDFISERMEV
ncbi:hypothetical protein SARC_00140 [Sphaeroforma arctica JP610]|uniref:RGS domain-containing protein n=1 Tax=Sphaeroforma arctica JP610 TaxID=667725 RepID=A0A0L0GHF0_9EUKA|nr:hypothetical protein SARC_00140 [Sphaeroforma arctica JP610]KNC87768.1 hypothetical protein SARC_00140 [Sphaeroforma arctica JP610]|eukprot:XP_014161670.1 hypothetical protein SARC_00140 [Sphaeroforma arctica JP610]